MADILRIKRRAVGGAAGAPASLAAAELAYNEQDDTLYYGKGNSGGAATSIIPVAGPGAFQAKDGDLTSLAAASSTGVIYYRSAADTWGPVTIGSGLSFSSGTLTATGGGTGNVSNSGTPAAGQVAEWTDATHVQGVSTYAKLASPVFTGDPQAPTPAATDNDTSIATTAYVRSVVRSAYGVRGLTGSAAASVSTQIIFSYTECVVHDSSGVGVLLKGGSHTIASGTVGANGCDVALADGDVHVYEIWGTTPGAAGICSNTGPATGPALPSTYTHWAYLTTIKRASGAFYYVAIRGNKVVYANKANIANNVNAGSWTSYSSAAYVPAIATNVMLNCFGRATCSGSGIGGIIYQVGWTNAALYVQQVDVITSQSASISMSCMLANVSQAVWHQWQAAYNVGNFSANGFTIDVVGFEIPNDS